LQTVAGLDHNEGVYSMPRLKEDQLQKIYDERKRQITSAAVKIFAQHGLMGSKISMIAAEAGVSHGLFYHYFKTKEELFTSLVREAIETSIADFDRLSQMPGSPIEKIKSLMVLGKGYAIPRVDWLLRFVSNG
jgi:AcrR family transcriptional regulator